MMDHNSSVAQPQMQQLHPCAAVNILHWMHRLPPPLTACRPDESASELVMFGWSADKKQLRKLGSVPLYNHIDAAGFGMPLRLSAVPKCPTGRPASQHGVLSLSAGQVPCRC